MNERLKDRLMYLVLAGGFATMAVEVRYLHREVLREEWQASIPVVFSAVAAFACLAAVTEKKWSRGLAAVVMALGLVVGTYGTFLHSDGKTTPFQRLLTAAVTVRADGDEDEGHEAAGHAEDGPPVLAPLGIAGLSAIGLLLALPVKRRSE